MPTKESVLRQRLKDDSFKEIYQIAWMLSEGKPIWRDTLLKYKKQYDSGIAYGAEETAQREE